MRPLQVAVPLFVLPSSPSSRSLRVARRGAEKFEALGTEVKQEGQVPKGG